MGGNSNTHAPLTCQVRSPRRVGTFLDETRLDIASSKGLYRGMPRRVGPFLDEIRFHIASSSDLYRGTQRRVGPFLDETRFDITSSSGLYRSPLGNERIAVDRSKQTCRNKK